MVPLLAAILLLIIFLILIKRVVTSNTKRWRPATHSLPGPPQLPIIGNLHQFLGGMPHRVLHDLARKHGRDLMQVRLGELDFVVVSSSEAAREMLKTHDLNFSNRPPFTATEIVSYGYKDIGFAPYGGYWRQLRKICVLQLLSARRVKDSFGIREEDVLSLVRDISSRSNDHQTINLSKELLLLANTMTARTAFGANCRQGKRFVNVVKRVLELSSGFHLADLYPSVRFIDTVTGASSKVKRYHREMDEILGEIIEDHWAKRAAIKNCEEEEDLVDVLLSLLEKEDLEFPLTVTNVKAVLLDMFLGGTETTSTTLGWAMAELMRHPQLMKKVQSEIRHSLQGKPKIENEDLSNLRYLKLFIKEALRSHPPFPLNVPRACVESCTVMGYDIPAGSRVLINTWAIGRDPKFWADAESFEPERFEGSSVDFAGASFDYLPFGGGRRICPGITFAISSIELVLAFLLFYFDWELPGKMMPEDLDMTEAFGATICKKSDLCLLAKPQTSSFTIA